MIDIAENSSSEKTLKDSTPDKRSGTEGETQTPPSIRKEKVQKKPRVVQLQDRLLAVRVVGDAIALSLAIVVASLLRFELGWLEITASSQERAESHATAAVFWLISFLALSAMNRLYDEDTLAPGGDEPRRLVRTAVEAVASLAVLAMFIRTFDVSRSWFSLLALLSLGGVALERGLIRWAIRKLQAAGKVRRPALLVSKSGVAWPSTFVSENDEFDVVAHIDPDALRRYAQASRRERNDGRFVDWAKAAVILRASEFEEDELWSLLMDAGQAGCSVYLHSSVRSIGRDRLTVRDLGGTTIVKISPPRFEGVPAILKRSMDLTVAGGMLLALSPVLVLLALGILITSGRPILYGQDRVGRNGKVFRMLKFRSMSTDAESQTGAVWAKKGDPRVTPLGRILRRTSLDELPQLFNILLGDMSLVGPRPERPIFVDQFAKELSWYQYRHRIRPGLTGWAQAHGLRGNTSLEQRVDFDNWYIEHWSPGLDLRIMFRTLWEVFQGDHAY